MQPPTEPRPTCPECGSVIDPIHLLIVSDHDSDDKVPPFLPILEDAEDRLSGIYCSSDCVLDAFMRGHAKSR